MLKIFSKLPLNIQLYSAASTLKNIDYYIQVIKYKELDKHLREWVPHYTTDIMR